MSLVNLKERGFVEEKSFVEEINFNIPYYPDNFIMPDYIKEKWRLEHAEKNPVHKTIPILQFNFLPGELNPGDQFNTIVMPRERKEKSRHKGGRGPHRIFQFRFTHNYIGHIIKGDKVSENYYPIFDKRIQTLPHEYIKSGLVYRFEVLTHPKFLQEDKYKEYKIFFCRPLKFIFEKNDLEHKLTHVHFYSKR